MKDQEIPLRDRLAVPIPDAARAIGISRSSLYKLIKAGTVETVHIAGRHLVRVESLEKLVKAA